MLTPLKYNVIACRDTIGRTRISSFASDELMAAHGRFRTSVTARHQMLCCSRRARTECENFDAPRPILCPRCTKFHRPLTIPAPASAECAGNSGNRSSRRAGRRRTQSAPRRYPGSASSRSFTAGRARGRGALRRRTISRRWPSAPTILWPSASQAAPKIRCETIPLAAFRRSQVDLGRRDRQ